MPTNYEEIWILTASFLDPDDPAKWRIGGVETAVYLTWQAVADLGIPVSVLQASEKPFEHKLDDGLLVRGIPRKALLEMWTQNRKALVFLTDHAFLDGPVPPVDIFHQHGVYWDGFAHRFRNPLLRKMHILKHRYHRWTNFRLLRRLVKASRVIVCVDTNFQNWYRGLWPWEAIDGKCVYVPNSAPLQVSDKAFAKWERNDRIRIVFARRFVGARGATFWAQIAADLLEEYPHTQFLFAGCGPDQGKMERICPVGPRVEYRAFGHKELVQELLNCHISVIPTVFCEGTSRSLLESMGAGSACVATPVGGICDIVRDEVNGLIAPPEHGRFKDAVGHLIEDRVFSKRLARRGWQTIQESHTEECWKARIRALVKSVLEGEAPQS